MNKKILKLLLLPWLILPSVSCGNDDSSTGSNNNSSTSVNTSTSEVLNKISNEKKEGTNKYFKNSIW